MLKAIAAFNFMMNIEGTVLNFEHGIKDLIQFPQSLWVLGKKSLDKPKKPCSMSLLSVYDISGTGNCVSKGGLYWLMQINIMEK